MKTEFTSNNKLIIIGNGFDLAHGLKTSYFHFILNYFNKAIEKKKDGNHFHSFNDELFEISNLYEADEIKPFQNLASVREWLKINETKVKVKNSFFQKMINSERSNWVDIESLFYEEIKRIYEMVENDGVAYDTHIYTKKDIHQKFVKKLNHEFEEIKTHLVDYLNTIETGVTSINAIESCLIQIWKAVMNEYNKGLSKPVHVLNFNYTNTFFNYSHDQEWLDVNHIHGSLKNQNNPLIFGYGDEKDSYFKKIERLNINAYLNYFKSFGYFRTGNYQKLLNFIEERKFDVLIWGHSCGLSDSVMLKSIFENKNCEKIHAFYHKWGNGENENDFKSKTMDISRHFDNKELLRATLCNFEISDPLN
ncbi:MAG: putative house-cleaning noncanonical NTP pyrophosphatase (MazG superfamily) [Arcticibacterium sp.]|jgi:predicted house-cleaning noncanonical NTP pyrophosphatase (MazG superfamily)